MTTECTCGTAGCLARPADRSALRPRTRRARARVDHQRPAQGAFRQTRPGAAEKLSPLEHAETDEAIARTAFYAALDDLEAGA